MADMKRSLAIVVGVNAYKNGIPKLKTAVNDARELAHILESKYQYQVLKLLDTDATSDKLNQLLIALEKQELPLQDGSTTQISSDNRLLFYFAGHGIALDALDSTDGLTGFLVPQDAQMDVEGSLLPMKRLHDALLKLLCRHLLVILDCCFAGAFRWAGQRNMVRRDKMYRERYERFVAGCAQQVITSSADDEKAVDCLYRFGQRVEHEEHSPFAEVLFRGLTGEADLSKDGVITATELYVYIHSELVKTTIKQTPGFCQLKRHDKGEYIFATPDFDPDKLILAPVLDESTNPYRGLKSFEEEHHALFFGRTAIIEKLQEFVTAHPLTVVLGASGSGKSSLVKAGLIPQLRKTVVCEEKLHTTSLLWRIFPPICLGESPFTVLSTMLVQEKSLIVDSQGSAAGTKTLFTIISDWIQQNPNGKLLLVIDQFEELITLCNNDFERKKFLSGLADAIKNYSKHFRIVITLRSDFEPQFRDTPLELYWNEARFIIPAMTREELREAIVEPAAAKVIYFEPQILIDKIIDEVIQMPGALPLLSFTLSELYLKCIKSARKGKRNNRAITQQDYEELGGVTRSLTQRADFEYDDLVKIDSAYATTIKHVMLRMVAVGSGDLARRRVLRDELEYPESEDKRVKDVIERFVAARLLVKGQDSENHEYIEPAHEVLVRGWQKLLNWDRQEQENLILQRRLTPAAMEWKAQQQKQFLWNADPHLDLLQQVLNSHDNWFNKVEAEFVQSSILQRRNNRLWIGSWIVCGFAIVLIFAFIQWNGKQDAQIKNWAISSEKLFASNQELDALIEALKAGKQLQKLKSLGIAEVETQRQVLASLGSVVFSIKEYNRFNNHNVYIQAISFSPDSQMIASANHDKTVTIWQKDGKLLKTLKGHGAEVNSVSFSLDGQTIASASNDNTVKLWRQNGILLKTLKGHSAGVNSVSFSPDGQTIASASNDNTVKLWRQDGILLKTLKGHNAGVNSVSFSPDGQTIASASNDNTVKLWSQDGILLKTLKGHNAGVNSVSFSPDGQTIASASNDNTVKLWHRDGTFLINLTKETGHTAQVRGVSFSPDSQTVISASADYTVKIWKRDGVLLKTLAGYSATFSPDGKIVASVSANNTIKLWKCDSNLRKTLIGPKHGILSISFSPLRQVIASANWDQKVQLWNRDGTLFKTLLGHNAEVYSVSFSPDGQTLASSSTDKTVKLWKQDGTLLKTFLGHHAPIYNVSFSPNGQTIASASDDKMVKLWRKDGTLLKNLEGHTAGVTSVSFSPDSQMIASAGWDNTIRLWKVNGTLFNTLTGHTATVRGVSFSPDGQMIASAGWDNTVRLWKVDGTLLNTLTGHDDAVWDVSFSPDGQIIASASRDKTIKLWKSDGTFLMTLTGHGAAVWDVGFSPNGKTLASASDDRTIILWDFKTLDLNHLLRYGCDWVQEYLNNPNANIDQKTRHLCDEINKHYLDNNYKEIDLK